MYETPLLTGDYAWVPGMEAFATTLPNSDRPNVQLVPGGGRYEFRIRSYTPGVAALDVRAVIERRPGALTSTGVLPLNVWLANGIAPTAATAAANARLQSILTRVDAILQQQGIVLGDVDYYDVDEPAFDDVTEAEFPYMLKLTAAATETRLNLFFVRTAIGGSTVGAAAAVGGPHRNGTAASGVMSVFDGGPPTLPASVIGLVVAHEIGHYTGLLHTVDSDGTYDIIDDTAECPATGADAICPAEGGGYLMHWQALGGADLTPGQGFVVLRHPSIDPHPLPGPAQTGREARRHSVAAGPRRAGGVDGRLVRDLRPFPHETGRDRDRQALSYVGRRDAIERQSRLRAAMQRSNRGRCSLHGAKGPLRSVASLW